MAVWFQIISELFVNLAAAWFAVGLIEPQFNPPKSAQEFSSLIVRFIFGIISLLIAKFFRQKVRKK